jgi:transcription elongation factor GreA
MKYPITREGFENLKKELEFLRNTKRPKILLAIEEARAHGDISENAEYDAAKEEYQFLQKKIGEFEEMIGQSEVVEIKKKTNGKVEFGCVISLKNLDTDEEVAYTLVGPYESDIEKGKIAMSSPLGRALLNKEVGDEVSFSAPGGERTYEIISIGY